MAAWRISPPSSGNKKPPALNADLSAFSAGGFCVFLAEVGPVVSLYEKFTIFFIYPPLRPPQKNEFTSKIKNQFHLKPLRTQLPHP